MEIDNRLAERLDEMGISLSELWRRIVRNGGDVSYRTLFAIYNKSRTGFTARVMMQVCQATDTTLGEMFFLKNGKG